MSHFLKLMPINNSMDHTEPGAPKEPEKTLYILKAKPDALLNAETWLKKNGWQVTSTTQIREALTQIVQSRPRYIMICVDHPAPKARMLPKLFESALNTQVIVFLEKPSPSAVAMVAGHQYSLYPPVSGPAIDRTCSKIDTDRKRAQEASENRDRLAKATGVVGENDKVSVKGSSGIGDEKILIQQKQAQDALRALMKSADTESAEDESKAADNARPSGIAYMPNHAESSSGAGVAEKKGPAYIPSGDSTSRENAAKSGSIEKKSAGHAIQAGTSGEAKSATQESGAAQCKAVMRGEFIRPGTNDRIDKKFIDSTQEAIDIAAVADLQSPIISLGNCDQVVCFPVGTAQKHGYILCAIAATPEPLEKFIPVFRGKLLELMLDVDKDFMVGDPLMLNLQSVPFQAWSQSQATFMKKFVHADRECAVSYFDHEMPEPSDVPENIHPSMMTVDFHVVKPERKLEFDFFLHFPRNAKFIRYGKRGFTISAKQRNRLVDRGVNWVHMPHDQRRDLFRYRLQVFFDLKIAEFFDMVGQAAG